jgi:hypothetical protein
MIAAWALVSVFFAVALVTFLGFVALSFTQTTPVKEDWKKFCSAFAGTALALSVGFGSLMLQQNAHHDEERVQAQRKIDEENAQVKARLLYSIAQKKLELDLLTGQEGRPHMEICDGKTGASDQEKLLAQLHSNLDAETQQFLKTMVERLFATTGYERGTLNRLMMESNLPSRLDQQVLDTFLQSELGFRLGVPLILSQTLELWQVTDSKTFCARTKPLNERWEELLDDAMQLQVSTCAAYAIMHLPAESGLEKSKVVVPLITELRRQPRDGKSRETWLVAQFKARMGENQVGFERCLDIAKIDLARLH